MKTQVTRSTLTVGVLMGLVVTAAACGGGSAKSSSTPGSTGVAALPSGRISHILVVELENQGYSATFGPGSPATYLNGVLRKQGELVQNYYATGHNSLDNYISQVSGQSPTRSTQGDCSANGSAFINVSPGSPDPDQQANPGQVDGQGCVYPPMVQTLANQLDAKYPPNPTTHVAAWRGYEEDMGNIPSRDGGVPDPTGGTDCGHPPIDGPQAVLATPTDQYATRHNPFVWFHSIIDNSELCAANDVPLGTLGPNGSPSPTGHLAQDLSSVQTTPLFGFVTPNLCNDGHDATCAGPNSGGSSEGGLTGSDQFLQHWMPLVLSSPAYKQGSLLVVITFDEADVNPSGNPGYAAACCGEKPGPNTIAPGGASATTNAAAPGGGQTGAVLLNAKYIRPGTTDTTDSYNHYSALRSYEDLLGLASGGADGQGHLGFSAAAGLRPFA
jgi:hypothetical protein